MSSPFHLRLLHYRCSHIPNAIVMLHVGATIGDTKFCSSFVEKKWLEAQELLQLLPKLHDPQVAVTLTYCAHVHVVHTAHWSKL